MALRHRAMSVALGLSSVGCAPLIDYSAPPGFVEAEADWQSQRYKGKDSVGLRVTVYDNVDGGTLDYWSNDLKTKLIVRGYALEGTSPLRAKNDVPGLRYDFKLEREGDEVMFLSVGLFVTDDYRYVTQLAGLQEEYAGLSSDVPALFQRLEPGGCKVGKDSVCRAKTNAAR